MPDGGAGHRSAQMGLLAGLHHERATDPKLGELLAIVENSDLIAEPGSPAAVNIRELRRSYDRRVRLPRALVEELARTTSLAQPEWVAARAASDFTPLPALAGKDHPTEAARICLFEAAGRCWPGGRPCSASCSVQRTRADRLPRRSTIHFSTTTSPVRRRADLAAVFQALRRDLVPLAARIADASRRSSPMTQSAAEGSSGRHQAGPAILEPVLPARAPASLRRGGRGGRRIRFSPRQAGRNRPPVLLGDRAGRLPDHHPVRRAQLQRRLLRNPPRSRARPLRAGARSGPLRHTDG